MDALCSWLCVVKPQVSGFEKLKRNVSEVSEKLKRNVSEVSEKLKRNVSEVSGNHRLRESTQNHRWSPGAEKTLKFGIW